MATNLYDHIGHAVSERVSIVESETRSSKRMIVTFFLSMKDSIVYVFLKRYDVTAVLWRALHANGLGGMLRD